MEWVRPMRLGNRRLAYDFQVSLAHALKRSAWFPQTWATALLMQTSRGGFGTKKGRSDVNKIMIIQINYTQGDTGQRLCTETVEGAP